MQLKILRHVKTPRLPLASASTTILDFNRMKLYINPLFIGESCYAYVTTLDAQHQLMTEFSFV